MYVCFCLPRFVEQSWRGHTVRWTNLQMDPAAAQEDLRQRIGPLLYQARARGSTSSRSKLWIKLLKMEPAAPRFSLPVFARVKILRFHICSQKILQLLLIALRYHSPLIWASKSILTQDFSWNSVLFLLDFSSWIPAKIMHFLSWFRMSEQQNMLRKWKYYRLSIYQCMYTYI